MILDRLEQIEARLKAWRIAHKTYNAAVALDPEHSTIQRQWALKDVNEALQLMDEHAVDDLEWCVSEIGRLKHELDFLHLQIESATRAFKAAGFELPEIGSK